MSPIFVAVLLNALAFALIYLVTTRRIRKALSATDVMDSIREEVHSLVVELNQTTDRNVSLTEERMKRLQKLIGEADRKIQLLGRETEKHQVGLDVYQRLKESARAASEPVRDSATGAASEPAAAVNETLSERVLRLAQQGFDARIIAQKLGTNLGEVELILSLRHGRSG